MSRPIITLTTDFGLADIYVGVMKGVIASIVPEALLIDLTHEIAPGNLVEAAIKVQDAAPWFPPGTVHLVVVDPGVGSARAALLVEAAGACYVAPDNGVLTGVFDARPPERLRRIDTRAPLFTNRPPAHTFHGRDIFAPVAAHVAAGTEPAGFTTELASPPVRLNLPEPEYLSDTEEARVVIHFLYTDHFGNLITDLTRHDWDQRISAPPFSVAGKSAKVRLPGGALLPIVRTYSDVSEGAPLAYFGSTDRLEVAVRDGNASSQLHLTSGETFLIEAI